MTTPSTPTGKRWVEGRIQGTGPQGTSPSRRDIALAIEAEAYEQALIDVLRAHPVCEKGHRKANPHIHWDDAHETARRMLVKRREDR